ncbi:MAG TPA: glucose 1-dehydrogenase [Candidatus Baltobacteraceae bacterium]|nr:glucose 1-dehydrogenase [Candidatus Baltobacteraceae bacterium]
MKAVAVFPKAGNSQSRLIEVEKPTLEGAGPNAVLVRVLAVGVDGTDKEILAGEYGSPPPGFDYLITGHESLGIVEAAGSDVIRVRPGDHVVATVRRPGSSIYDTIGAQDFTLDSVYFERGINLRHGYLTEYYLEDEEHLTIVPPGLGKVGVLLEPCSVVEKGITQAYEIQRRLRVWRPRRAAVLGAGTVGLLATLALRLRGLQVHTFATAEKPNTNAELIERIGGTYHAVGQRPFAGSSAELGAYDIIFEATGYAPLAFEAMGELNKNGVLILSSVTGGKHTIEIDADKINLEFVLGNKVVFGTVNAGREDFERGVADFSRAELTWPGWLNSLLTHPVRGLESYQQLIETLTHGQGVIKAYCEVSQ